MEQYLNAINAININKIDKATPPLKVPLFGQKARLRFEQNTYPMQTRGYKKVEKRRDVYKEVRNQRRVGERTDSKKGENGKRHSKTHRICAIHLHCLHMGKSRPSIRKSHYRSPGFILYPIDHEGSKALFSPRD